MRWVAVIGVFVGLLLVAYAAWLLVTPDNDGGRRPVGGMVVGPAAALLAVSIVWLMRSRQRS